VGFDLFEQMPVVERLGQKVDRAPLHGLHGEFDIAPRGHGDHRCAALQFRDERQALFAGGGIPREVHIGEDEVEGARG
jgi:hypothetical protein